jgi:hypothetical protein
MRGYINNAVIMSLLLLMLLQSGAARLNIIHTATARGAQQAAGLYAQSDSSRYNNQLVLPGPQVQHLVIFGLNSIEFESKIKQASCPCRTSGSLCVRSSCFTPSRSARVNSTQM